MIKKIKKKVQLAEGAKLKASKIGLCFADPPPPPAIKHKKEGAVAAFSVAWSWILPPPHFPPPLPLPNVLGFHSPSVSYVYGDNSVFKRV